jgi:hypothetical protein
MFENEFRRPVSIDFAPEGSVCEWCGKPAVYQITAIGGIHHNEQGLFCSKCGVQYICAIADFLDRVVMEESLVTVP